MTDDLPPPHDPAVYGYTSADMCTNGDARAAAERERCSNIVRAYQVPVGNSAAGEMAADWTMDALREIDAAIRATEAKPPKAP